MASRYGRRWTSNYGPADTEGEWTAALADVAPRRVAEVLQLELADEFPDWPPTLHQFRHLCAHGPRSRKVAAPYHRELPRGLIEPPRNPEVAEKYLDIAMRIVGRRRRRSRIESNEPSS